MKHEYVNLNERVIILLLVYLNNKCLYKKSYTGSKISHHVVWKGEKVENKRDPSFHIHTFTSKPSCWEL